MAKVKRFLTEQEDKLVSELRSLQNGNITQETIDAAVKEQRGINTAFYHRGELSVEAFMSETFGSIEADDVGADEPAETFLIDFQ